MQQMDAIALLGSVLGGEAAKVLSSVLCGARSRGQDSSLHIVIRSEVLEFHFIDELDENQSRPGQVMEPNSCTKPVKQGPIPMSSFP